MIIEILATGIRCSTEDRGQYKWLDNGVPVGGAADKYSHGCANRLLCNLSYALTVETAGAGFTALVTSGGWCGFSGVGGQWVADAEGLENNSMCFLPSGTLLKNIGSRDGNYAYLSVPGGFAGQRSAMLSKGDILRSKQGLPGWSDADLNRLAGRNEVVASCRFYARALTPLLRNSLPVIRVIPGAEEDWWSPEQRRSFYENSYKTSLQSNRMGIRLNGIALPCSRSADMLSTGVCPGTVQVPPDGMPIVLMADAQTTGGYPRIAQVAAVDLPVLAQMPPGTSFFFERISLATAEKLMWI